MGTLSRNENRTKLTQNAITKTASHASNTWPPAAKRSRTRLHRLRGLGSMRLQRTQWLIPLNLQDESTKLMWFGFNFNDSFTPQQIIEYQKQLNNKSKKPLNAKMISGIVSDKSGPLPGVSVVIKGIQRRDKTDFDGYYQREAAIGEELRFLFNWIATKKNHNRHQSNWCPIRKI